jgi:hypothetical protein
MERGLLPEYLCYNTTHNTRGGSDFTLPYFRRAYTQNSLFYNTTISEEFNDEFQNIKTLGKTWQKALLEL